jgi:epoxyqueuosine reductase
MKQKLKDFCSSLNIEYVGIAPIGPYTELEKVLLDVRKKGHYTSFEEQDIQKRIDPRLTMENVKSIIVCLFPYHTGYVDTANISNYTYSLDYHIIAKKKLEAIGKYLESQIENFNYKAFVDIGPLSDKYLANLAGLGYFGINSNIITDKYGSYVFIGYILNNYAFEPDKPLERTCIKCGACVKSCPSSAILGDFTINPHRCISYLTQKKDGLPQEEVEIIQRGRLVFGCDICQTVCPHNRKIEITNIDEFKHDLIYNLDYNELLNMSNKEFKRKYGDRAFSWRGKSIIIRNFKYMGLENSK